MQYYWNYSQWNEIVKEVEQCSIRLRSTRKRIYDGIATRGYNRIAVRMLGKLNTLIKTTDKEALCMTALYDWAAEQMVKERCELDPRRGSCG
jgi:hypothetical protein